MTRTDSRSNIFDFLRLFAASIVVVQHSNTALNTNMLWGIPPHIDGVPIFFIISGFFVYLSGESIYRRTGGFKQFFKNRALRILPALWLFAILAPLILAGLGAVPWKSLVSPNIIAWLGSFVLLVPKYQMPPWDGVLPINDQLYTIPAECSFYVIVPLMILAAKRWGFWRMMSVMIVLALVGAFLNHNGPVIVQRLTEHTFMKELGCFIAGVILAKYWAKLPQTWWLFGAAVVLYVGVQFVGDGTFIYASFKPVIIAAPLAYAVVFLGYRGWLGLKVATDTVGDLSYATYIWHALVYALFAYFGITGQWWMVALVLVITWMIAAASWWSVEKRALAMKEISLRRSTRKNVPATLSRTT